MRKLEMEEMGRLTVEEFKESAKFPFVIVLDNIRSLNNVGSFFRTADAFRAQKIILCGYTQEPPHREITRSAIGAELSVDLGKERRYIECRNAATGGRLPDMVCRASGRKRFITEF
jgi:23S rRNA (guanosine2251-2'-O)-methyltransferase